MVKIDAIYEGNLRCRLSHGPSSEEIQTDAPTDNQGEGKFFSPTDLVPAALGSCMLTVMGIVAAKHGVVMTGTRVSMTKEMVSQPSRRIGKMTAFIEMAPGIAAAKRKVLENAAMLCPVKESLHPEVQLQIQFHYPD